MIETNTEWGIEWEAAAALLASLVDQASRQDQVCSRSLADGFELLAYPIAGQGQVLVGLGLPAVLADNIDSGALLRRRGARMEDCGDWLPARLEDGSLYLLRRWPAAAWDGWPGGAAAALRLARELFDE